MTPADAARTDLHASMQQTLTPDPCPTPTTRCPRCKRNVTPSPIISADLTPLGIIDPCYDRYARRAEIEERERKRRAAADADEVPF